MRTVKVEFKKNGKQYIFLDNNIELAEEENVIVETEKGLQFGKITSVGESTTDDNHALVIRIASKEDEKQHQKNIKEAEKALVKAEEIAGELGLEMKFIDASFTFDKKQLIFQFLADNRVDFRELAKSLAAIYKTRIELRQVGARDKAKEVSGIGPCGRKLCCSQFLTDLDSVGIAQVKNQNLALNPTKINGACGRLLCCLKFEDDVYTEYRKNLPEVGDKLNINGKDATVISLDIPRQKYTVMYDEDNTKEEVDGKKEKIKRDERRKSNK
jgi:cell fate regulator YaaT (PSP1 superfamily)